MLSGSKQWWQARWDQINLPLYGFTQSCFEERVGGWTLQVCTLNHCGPCTVKIAVLLANKRFNRALSSISHYISRSKHNKLMCITWVLHICQALHTSPVTSIISKKKNLVYELTSSPEQKENLIRILGKIVSKYSTQALSPDCLPCCRIQIKYFDDSSAFRLLMMS